MQIDSWSIILDANYATTNLTLGQVKEGLIIHECEGSIKLSASSYWCFLLLKNALIMHYHPLKIFQKTNLFICIKYFSIYLSWVHLL